jgi:predicted nucleic acid-binding protein
MAKANNPAAEPQQQRVRAFFRRYQILPFDHHTIPLYSLLRAKLWHMCGSPKGSGRGHVQKLPEELCDPVSGLQLGIDERDLQIVSIALQHGLVFATLDRNDGMKRIEAAAAELERDGALPHLEVEDWTPPAPAPAPAPAVAVASPPAP